MLKVGDTVKVIGEATTGHHLIRYGTICTVLTVSKEFDGKFYYGLSENKLYGNRINGYYFEDALEKGHLEWVKE